ncbi:zf-HC2 domain-containing protein [Arthrobacter gengyunqii]|uniref:Zf-HC2 domain-containing protein n=1 Tax=Arthrobacter gengyunqii TaxID=2886940 RepID=A0ABS8GLM6_9MICC|nr:zf-HC2 domain-containing protein [Arthrobacter gengyunqii]MCC3267253.1 zf-HC2 domain-containing protein [Arthrobacter gengyunqii]
MRHPKRLLQEYLDGQASPARAAALQAHLSRCAACRSEAARERRLRARLRSLEVPEPSPLLRERIERTAQMAGDAAPDGYAQQPVPSGGGRHRLVTATGVVAAAVGLVLSTAYLLGGWAQPPALQQATPGLAAVWSEVTGGTPDDELAPEQLAELRSRGWACPELAAAGLSVAGARAGLVDGHPAVIMTLEGNGNSVTVYETHPGSWSEETVVDGVSGKPVTEEGFVLQEQSPGRPQIWMHPQRPHQAVVASSRVTYTLAASPDVLDEAVSEISLTESSRLVLHARDTAYGVWDRIKRGLSVMTGTGEQE